MGSVRPTVFIDDGDQLSIDRAPWICTVVVLITDPGHAQNSGSQHAVQFPFDGRHPHPCQAQDLIGVKAPVRLSIQQPQYLLLGLGK
jgi:hypothetical protein